MKTRMSDFWLIKSNQAANVYMDEVAKESNFTGCHKGYTIVPHKLHRCYGLNEYEKLILVDIIAYMSDKSQCYPTMEMIARNIGCSSKTVERHIANLAEKKLILVSHSKNNTYYLPNYLHVHPYLLLSEKTHEFIGSVKKQVNERELTLWIQGIVKSEDYEAFTTQLQRLHERRLPIDKFAEKEILDSYVQYLTTAFVKRFPADVNV
ncbi:helix-turn-helix domain-containing protein [Paenibacillus chitinolyticus]|uniref:helix-turn-helix domain-containing protein n=1 Tax=Paenibacillus chitinolyticus TaxID=79263 RepID=UPI002DB57E2E|nr:helix-turn-helix domain-containing protein [Paenibacillus chitinolyticus]MEC0248176.1 helix-turn-helix domain-containing protein [Paenibacillus chitinolyticus]